MDYSVHTQKDFPNRDAAASFDAQFRTEFGFAAPGHPNPLEWADDERTVRIDFEIQKVHDALALVKIYDLIGGGVSVPVDEVKEIRKRAA